MTTHKYLERIRYFANIECSSHVLARLHERHVLEVPFENLDVYYKNIFDLEINKVFEKIVDRRRGGFCYELNLLFNWLLTEIGFSSRIIACRIFDDNGVPGPEFDHMAVCVETPQQFLVDVGYGDLFLTPMRIASDVQFDGRNYFKIERVSELDYVLFMSPDQSIYTKRYVFSLGPVKSADFNDICLSKQTDPTSYFVKNLICTKPTHDGRITIFNDKLIATSNDSRVETLIESHQNLTVYLKEHFGIIAR